MTALRWCDPLFVGAYVEIAPSEFTDPDDDPYAHCCGHVAEFDGEDVLVRMACGDVYIARRRLFTRIAHV